MSEFRERMRQWREARKLTQKKVASRLDRPQAWISNRERGEVDITVDEAIEILRAMGYAADMVVVDGAHPQLLDLVAKTLPKDATLALRLLEVLPRLEKGQRDMLVRMIEAAAPAETEPDTKSEQGVG